MVFKIQWKPFWLATKLYPQNAWAGLQSVRLNFGTIAWAAFLWTMTATGFMYW